MAIATPHVASRDSECSSSRPAFLITIDTECDNAWARSHEVTTHNARYVSRFQELCERFQFKPTWLVNYEMAGDRVFKEFAQDVLKRDAGEVGMHLHAWHSPPEYPLTTDDYVAHPYLVEYPQEVMREKLTYMTRMLEDTFQRPITSHRAGRWNLNEVYVQELIRLGYRVDCSVTPHQNWTTTRGGLPTSGGADYRGFPEAPYLIDEKRINLSGASPLLEVPMTIRPRREWVRRGLPNRIAGLPKVRGCVKRMSPLIWLRPTPTRSVAEMMWLVSDSLSRKKLPHLEFMLHSSELMPGGSSAFPDDRSIEDLYADLEQLFEFIEQRATGTTLTGFYQACIGRSIDEVRVSC